MSLYSRTDEERVRLHARVADWVDANLLTQSQGDRLAADLTTDLRRTNRLLRAALALFTIIVVVAAVALVVVATDLDQRPSLAVITALAAAISFAIACRLVAVLRFYRHGVEEGLAICSIGLAGFSAYETIAVLLGHASSSSDIAFFVTAAIGSAIVYATFGFVYAGVAALVAAAMIPFNVDLMPPYQRLAGATLLLVAFLVARAWHRRTGDDYPGDDVAVFEAAAWILIYVTLNIHLGNVGSTWLRSATSGIPEWFRWSSYAATWILPAVGLTLGLRDKQRPLVDANLALAIATLATNKLYLGWPRQTWDPALLGLLLMGVALGVRRWLASSPGGEVRGFTEARLGGDRDALRALTVVSATVRPPAAPTPTEPPSPLFEGGRSGGGGAGGSF
jgi:hypothetical protein